MRKIMINCDLGEGQPYDEQLMPLIDSCSIACGGHFGNEETMKKTVTLAMKHGINIGAHPSFPDRKNFGRKPYKLTHTYPADHSGYIERKVLLDSLENQVIKLKNITEKCGAQLDHIKAHGALYNVIASRNDYAECFLELLDRLALDVFIYTPWNARVVALASQSKRPILFKKEAFADRRYTAQGQLVSRSNENALIHDPILAWKQVLGIFRDQKVQSLDHQSMDCQADTFCIHGDSKNALNIAKYIRLQASKSDQVIKF